MKSKIFQIGGIIALMITMTACGNQAQAETMEPTTVVETTMQETTAEPTTEETYADGSYSGARDNGDAFVKLDLPTLSTGKTFDEMESMQYEIVYDSWSTSSDEEKVALGREGLMDKLGSLVDFTDQEKDEVADYILSKSPIPAQEASKQESKPSSQPSQSQNQTQTQSKPKETQASVQPTSPQVQETEPVVNNNTELSPEMQERQRQLDERKAAGKGSFTHEAGEGHGGDDLKDADTSHLNIGGM